MNHESTKSKHVKQFLGLAGFYRHFINNYADITEPLNKLTRKHAKFEWSDQCENAFNAIINFYPNSQYYHIQILMKDFICVPMHQKLE